MIEIIKDFINNRKLIWNLSKNDFKSRFAGSYLGIVWAFVQPVITVFIYWFVFTKALTAAGQITKAGIAVPYVIWLVAGLVPWFFFSEAWSMGTNSLIEYNYLVKKVVFKIDILPIVKICSSLFVHLFFILFAIILYMCYGFMPDAYTLQVFYYSFCMIIFVLGISYFTCSAIIFFKDLGQIVNILLQVGIWVTPIMWNYDSVSAHFPGWVNIVLHLNPLFYIVSGYRDSFISKVGFWEHPKETLYFWILTLCVFWFGTYVFKKLKIHFADIL